MSYSDPRTYPLFSAVEHAVRNIPGWSPIDQLYTLASLVIITGDLQGDVLEVGSWCGRSTVALGIGARAAGHTRVIAVDLFPERSDWYQNDDGSYSLKVQLGSTDVGAYTNHTVWKDPFEKELAPIYERYGSVYHAFEEAIARERLQDVVLAIRGTSSTMKQELRADFKCRVAFIDGDHDYDAVCRDIRNVESYLVDNGWICFDDAFSTYDGVNRAITECVVHNPAYDICQQMTRKCFAARKGRRT